MEYIQICGCSFEKELSQILRMSGIVTCSITLVIELACTITELFTLKLQSFVLSLYLVLFVVATLFAELRFIECFRNFTFRCLKHIYFVSSYTGRGLFYIFIGTLMFDRAIGYILGVAMIIIGLVNVTAASLCPGRLPVFVDKWAMDDDQLQGAPHLPAPPPTAKAPPMPTPGSSHFAPAPPTLPQGPNPVNPFAAPHPPPLFPQTEPLGSAFGTAASPASGPTGLPLHSGMTWLKEHKDQLTVENLEFATKIAKLVQGTK